MIHEDFRFQDPRHQANRFWYGRWYIRKQCGVAYSSACSITNNITCDKNNPKPEKGEKSSYWMILNLRTLNSDYQMLFSIFYLWRKTGPCWSPEKGENKLNAATKKHSFMIDKEWKKQPPHKIVSKLIQDNTCNSIFLSVLFFIAWLWYAAHKDMNAMKKSLDVLLKLRCQLLIRLNAAFCL